jgi:hypothetical protein
VWELLRCVRLWKSCHGVILEKVAVEGCAGEGGSQLVVIVAEQLEGRRASRPPRACMTYLSTAARWRQTPHEGRPAHLQGTKNGPENGISLRT